MKSKQQLSIIILIALSFIFTSMASAQARGLRYRVTITNLTRGQIFSPPIVITHSKQFALFTLGQPASPELASLAEDGDTGPLSALLQGNNSVMAYAMADGPILPGQSKSIDINANGFFGYISLAGMLVTTNDGFVAINGKPLRPAAGSWSLMAAGYDAGSERNSEDCAFIPGPPCGSHGVRDTEGAEGFVHIHAGIHGIGSLNPDESDWRNPVAKITIEKLR